jgi:HPt (histidine-containing phosphotransfer) domain-containing protein
MSHPLSELEATLGPDTVRTMATIFAAEWRRQARVIVAPELPPESGERHAKRQAAHDLVTNAGSMGFNDLSIAARRLEQAILKGDALETANAAALIPALADLAVSQLAQRYGPL